MITVRSEDGTAIAVQRQGSGPALVLVAGALTPGAAFRPLAQLLAPSFTVHAYDRRGRGGSGDTPPYAVEREIEDLAAVIAGACGQAYVFGHSSGAILALETAAAGHDIAALALYEPPLILSGQPMPADFSDQLAALVAADRRGDALALWMRLTARQSDEAIAKARRSSREEPSVSEAPQLASGTWRTEPWWAGAEAIVHTTPYDATISAPYTRAQPLVAPHWAQVRVPALVLDGEVSPPVMRAGAAAVVDLLPDATAQTLPGQAHGAPPEMIAPLLTTFFTGGN
jgi:pimeloyl-ACP methyl ester carboxylesterase